MTAGPKTLVIDIETLPNIAHIWGLFNQNIGINQIEEATTVTCFAAGWHDEKKIGFWADWQDGGRDRMLEKAYDLTDQADIIVGYNSQSFDMRHLKREWWLAEKTPPSPYLQIDLLKEVRGNFYMTSNKLDWVAKQAGVGEKVKHSGHELWTGIMEGNEEARRLMEKYNRGDVRITKGLYDRIRPWIKKHPHMGMFNGEAFCCTNCGSTDLQKRGIRPGSNNMMYQRYQCNGCGAWNKSSRGDKDSRTLTRSAAA
jgi:hypothetical protein